MIDTISYIEAYTYMVLCIRSCNGIIFARPTKSYVRENNAGVDDRR